MNDPEDASVDVAWLHYVAGLTQAQIAKQRGLSKATVHRLLRAAHESGAVRVFVGERPASTVKLERDMVSAFGLETCRLVPSVLSDVRSVTDGVAALAAQSLLAQLEANRGVVFGLGAGRTLAAMAAAFPRVSFPAAEFVSLTGDFSVFRTEHSTDVIRRLADRTGGTGYSIAAPILANSQADRDVLVSQAGTRIAFQKIRQAGSTFIGIGHLHDGSFLSAFNLLNDEEISGLRKQGVVADLCGTLLDAGGQPVDCDVGQRMLACRLDDLRGKRNTAVAFGETKIPAIKAVLKTGLLSELISDAATAEGLLKN
ncbi:sugar-binding transcriptional regulator [Hoeflea prorocentri]|uniref:DNA-binding transcriptional regulator n=1 Tax=Hoeflea prorocentri TaxID=1922333 RepID=A0A9X3UJ34_9HYPH|nr:sugar-binding domain-containing protein [Hoeflea prorocentri]MCY6381562.1 hypothetical protein [Hoeflea prorocentri]MDA5399362.1 hypothetical protein [Hoeflea prorocentri]